MNSSPTLVGEHRVVQVHLAAARESRPSMTSSMLGCVAAVIETESPSQPSPAVIHRTWTSETAGAFCVTLP